MIIRKEEFDLNYKDIDLDCCKVCGYSFSSFEEYYVFKNCWSGDDNYIMCFECLGKTYKELKKFV